MATKRCLYEERAHLPLSLTGAGHDAFDKADGDFSSVAVD